MRHVMANECACGAPLGALKTGEAHTPNMYCSGSPKSGYLMSIEEARQIVKQHPTWTYQKA